ncbi:hypothetical protein [Paludisphaera mucosa]|uniref:Uncharacterized protein n=1 Tax=Paludisphaera mucosa TaxID=3030827 RepID=A0ABT6FIK6_9BACT|nr:hypothetical protein [Paludisphaera mucosa]MDG3007369.1 hypothetical protein [Paludisphaera mucosa]
MERATEEFALITCLVVGLSHILQRRVWTETYVGLHRLGKPGALLNGGLSLFTGAALVAFHPVWKGLAMALTILGWMLVLKGAVCFLAPDAALRSMGKASDRGFAAGGVVLLIVAAVLGFVLAAT